MMVNFMIKNKGLMRLNQIWFNEILVNGMILNGNILNWLRVNIKMYMN